MWLCCLLMDWFVSTGIGMNWYSLVYYKSNFDLISSHCWFLLWPFPLLVFYRPLLLFKSTMLSWCCDYHFVIWMSWLQQAAGPHNFNSSYYRKAINIVNIFSCPDVLRCCRAHGFVWSFIFFSSISRVRLVNTCIHQILVLIAKLMGL